MRKLIPLCLLCSLFSYAFTVNAADGLEVKFNKADRNGDGLLTREEAAKGFASCLTTFDALDANRDRKLSLEEMRAGNRSDAEQVKMKKK